MENDSTTIYHDLAKEADINKKYSNNLFTGHTSVWYTDYLKSHNITIQKTLQNSRQKVVVFDIQCEDKEFYNDVITVNNLSSILKPAFMRHYNCGHRICICSTNDYGKYMIMCFLYKDIGIHTETLKTGGEPNIEYDKTIVLYDGTTRAAIMVNDWYTPPRFHSLN